MAGVKWPAFPKVDPLAAEDITDLGNVVLTGDIRAAAWDGGSDLSDGADPDATAGFYLDSSAGTIQAQDLIAEGGSFAGVVSGDIVSENWDGSDPVDLSSVDAGATVGFALDSSEGAAQFEGDMFVGGNLELTSSGVIRTAPSGFRVELGGANPSQVAFYNAAGTHRGTIESSGDSFNFTSVGSGSTVLLQAVSNLDIFATNNITLEADSGHIRIIQGQFRVPDGTVGSPAVSFTNEPDTGMFLATTNQAGFSGGGTESFRTGNASSPGILVAAGDASRPGVSFITDPDSGVYLIGADSVGISAGNSLKMSFGTQVRSTVIAGDTTGSAANMFIVTATGQMQRSTSAAKYKTRVTYNVGYLADIELAPTKHWRPDDKKWRYSLVADDLAGQDPLLGEYDEDGTVENYDTSAVLAVLAAKVNRLENA